MPTAPKPTAPDAATPPCPICGKPVDGQGPKAARLRPFCSVRCADVDLGRWFGGAYTIPGPPGEIDSVLDDDGPDGSPR